MSEIIRRVSRIPRATLNNITPFTYRDGYTFLQRLEMLALKINELVETASEQNEYIDGFAESVNIVIDELEDQYSEFSAELRDEWEGVLGSLIEYTIEVTEYVYTARLMDGAEFNAYTIAGTEKYVSEQIVPLTDTINDFINDMNANMSDLETNITSSMNDFQSAVNQQITDIQSSVEQVAGDRTVTPRQGSGVNIKSGSPVNSVEGGTANTILGGGTTGNAITISGGNEAGTSGSYRVITGGYDHVIDSTGVGADVIGGGAHHRITGQATHGTIAGGSYNEIAAGDYGTVSGGTRNEITAAGATISGGRTNTATGQDSAIGGGVGNTAAGQNDVIAGGINNMANGPGATIGGGNGNRAFGRNSYVGSGDGNQLGEEGTSKGDYAYVGGGFRNLLGTVTSARYSAIPGGRECSVQHEYSTASGYHAVSRLPGAEVRASGSFATPGDAQTERLTLRRQTTDATPAVLGWNGLAAPPTMPANSTYMLEGTVVARRTDQAGSNRAWRIAGMCVRDGGAPRVIDPTITPLGAEGEAAAWDVTLTAGGSTIIISGVGAAGHTIHWLAQITLTELVT